MERKTVTADKITPGSKIIHPGIHMSAGRNAEEDWTVLVTKVEPVVGADGINWEITYAELGTESEGHIITADGFIEFELVEWVETDGIASWLVSRDGSTRPAPDFI